MDLELGSLVFSRYRILDKIGAGGVGTIYKVADETLQTEVVLKVLTSKHTMAKAMVRFQTEAKALARLKHRNIANVIDFGISELGEAYLTMTFVDGMTLRQLVDSNAVLPVSRILEIYRQILDGVAHAHKEGVIHRDLKPENIILNRNDSDTPIILDFGMAKLVGDDEESIKQSLTNQGSIIGSPYFMSPEQASGNEASKRADQYSLGCILFYLLARRPPFDGETAFETMAMHLEDRVPTLESATGRAWPDGFDALIERMMSKTPEERFESIEAVKSELQPLIETTLADENFNPPEPVFPDASSGLAKSKIVYRVLAGLAVVSVVGFAFSMKAADFDKGLNKVGPNRKGVFEKIEKNEQTEAFERQLQKGGEVKAFVSRNEDLAILVKYPLVRDLNLTPAEITDDGLKYLLCHSWNLLKFDGCRIKTLKGLDELVHLQKLSLADTDIDDQSLEKLYPMSSLHELDLRNTHVTAKAVKKLLPYLKNLTGIHLKNTGVSETQLAELMKEHPWYKVDDIEGPNYTDLKEIRELSAQKRYKDAFAKCKQLIAKFQSRFGADHAMLAYYWSELSMAAVGVGDTETALDANRQAIRVAEKSGEYRLLAQQLVLQAKGIAAVEKKPKEAIRKAERGRAMLEELDGKYARSLGDTYGTLDALYYSVDPRSPKVREYRESLVLMVELNPQLSEKECCEVYFTLALSEFADRDYAKAESHFRRFLKLQDAELTRHRQMGVASSWYYLSICCEKQGRISEALQAARKCVSNCIRYNVPRVHEIDDQVKRLERLAGEKPDGAS